MIHYSAECPNIFVIGDLNARTANMNDYVQNDKLHDSILDRVGDLFTYVADEALSCRNNPHAETNDYGTKLLDLCKSSGLRIINGRHPDGLSNDFTYSGPRVDISPSSWSDAILVPIFKSGDANDAANYRGISLVSNLANYYIPWDSRTRSGHRIRQIRATKEVYNNSFFPRSIRDWNLLPDTVAAAPSLEESRARLASVPWTQMQSN
ncbi:Hypothetical predicted protein [Mytilus galloprovincialis]|uniref:Endonuclease/exonuclease/phosphatase domain-containing protein n=1 Tax=Mytilus galloprovincialis TaxID=29158 RepID=A0A8B6CWY3_MYTGA|nr:Hypothetical predicted protein [Mytilus galloprovincialis]